MSELNALNFPLGPELEAAIRQSVEKHEAFCVLDQRTSPRRRAEEIALLGATKVTSPQGVERVDNAEGVDDDIALAILTSGSSGTPKAALHTWTSLEASARITQSTLRGDEPPMWFPCLPPNHIGGLAVILRSVFSDATLLWGNTSDLESGARLGATHISVVRTQLRRHDLSGYEKVLLGGAKPPFEIPDNVLTTWGMTETGSGVVYNGYALPEVEIATSNEELLVRTPTLFSRYRTAERPRALGPDGKDDWFPTGDGATIHDGKLSIKGRLGYVINTGGEKVWPEDLEEVLLTVAGVREVAVTGIDDPEWGQRVCALVVSEVTNLDEPLRAVAEERIGPWAKPKEIRYVAALPRTSNGKLIRASLTHLH